MMRVEPIITDGMLDSQNLAFWDPVRKEYYAYYRDFKNKAGDTRQYDRRKDYSLMDRDVRYATSRISCTGLQDGSLTGNRSG